MISKKSRPVVLMVLDGWGLDKNEDIDGNAIKLADTPNFDFLWNNYPRTSLRASGEDVGLPEGQMGNSEVGHLNLGAGRIVYQDLSAINKSIVEGTIKENPVLLETMQRSKSEGRALHLMGLLSDGGVHSHLDHLLALLELAREHELTKVYLHCFLDGRDVAPDSGVGYLHFLEQKISALGVGKVATVMGRYYAMDRDQRWDRNLLAYQALVLGEGKKAGSAEQAVRESYQEQVYDEFIKPIVIVDEANAAIGRIKPGDNVLFFNFRADRARQITKAFIEEDFAAFPRAGGFLAVNFVCLTQYDRDFKVPVAYPPQNLNNTLGEVISKQGLKQLRIAETEKYAHVTFFFNGGVEEKYFQEDRILIASPKVATYDLKPEMSAEGIANEVISKLLAQEYDFILVNFANPDMVGHTGDIKATIKAIETVDRQLGKIYKLIEELGGSLLITADHGNAEVMYEKNTKKPWTAHTSNPVPLILADQRYHHAVLEEGSLQDVAPTVLMLLKITKPPEMTGQSLIKAIDS